MTDTPQNTIELVKSTDVVLHEGEKIRIVIADDNEGTRASLCRIFQFEPFIEVVGRAENGDRALDLIKELRPDFCIADTTLAVLDGFTLTEKILEIAGLPTQVILLSTEIVSQDIIRLGMQKGARDIQEKPVDSKELVAAICRFHKKKIERNTYHKIKSITDDPARQRRHRVCCVTSGNGGSGKSVTAVNVAASLSRNGVKTLLIDADIVNGTVDVFLDFMGRSAKDLSGLVGYACSDKVDKWNSSLIPEYIIRHDPTGLDVLLSPFGAEHTLHIGLEHFLWIIENRKPFYEFIVIDVPTSIDDAALGILRVTDEVILVAEPSVGSLRNNLEWKKLIKTIHSIPDDQIHFVLNKTRNPPVIKGMDIVGIQDETNISFLGAIPFTDKMQIACDKGRPVILQFPDSTITEQIGKLAEQLHGAKLLPPAPEKTYLERARDLFRGPRQSYGGVKFTSS